MFNKHASNNTDMKTATFTYQDEKRTNSPKIYGRVTLKNDGKISITEIWSPSSLSYANKYQAKEYAKSIVAKNFPSDMCENFKDTNTSKGLASLLKDHTQELKADYLEKTKVYAANYFNHYLELLNRSEALWYDQFDIITKEQYGQTTIDYKLTSSRKLNEMRKLQRKCGDITRIGLANFTAKELKNAEDHYNSSIEKLAFKLNQKGITEDQEFEITSGRVKMNFECVIHHSKIDGKYTQHTKAWTIIAEGPIQRPHYRYLIK